MDGTVFIILGVIALGVLIIGLVLSREPKKQEMINPFPLRSAVRSLPPQSVCSAIPFGQAVGDYSDPEATYEEMEFAPSDWTP